MRRALIRIGLAASGVVYVATGVVSARVAFLGARNREAGVPGALRFLLDRPHGPQLLGAVVAGLAGIALVYGVEAWTGNRTLAGRLGLGIGAFGYAALAWTCARLLFHLGRSGVSLERGGVSWLLNVPGGEALLEFVGVAVLAGGLWEVYRGAHGKLDPARGLPRAISRCLAAVARFGLVARGCVLGALGYFLIQAAEDLDPARARSLGGVLRSFSHTALGPSFMGVVALGLAAYGVHLWALAVWKRRL